jgi:hypothetical protein
LGPGGSPWVCSPRDITTASTDRNRYATDMIPVQITLPSELLGAIGSEEPLGMSVSAISGTVGVSEIHRPQIKLPGGWRGGY